MGSRRYQLPEEFLGRGWFRQGSDGWRDTIGVSGHKGRSKDQSRPGSWLQGWRVSRKGPNHQPRGWNIRGCCQHTQAVGLLAPPVSLPVVPEPGVAGAQHSAEVVGALLLTRGLGAHVVICKRQGKGRLTSATVVPQTGRRRWAWVWHRPPGCSPPGGLWTCPALCMRAVSLRATGCLLKVLCLGAWCSGWPWRKANPIPAIFPPGPSPHPLGSAAHLDGPRPCSSTCRPVRAFSAAAVETGNSFQMHIREQEAVVRGVGTVGEREEGRSCRRGGAGGRFWNRAGVSDAG